MGTEQIRGSVHDCGSRKQAELGSVHYCGNRVQVFVHCVGNIIQGSAHYCGNIIQVSVHYFGNIKQKFRVQLRYYGNKNAGLRTSMRERRGFRKLRGEKKNGPITNGEAAFERDFREPAGN